MPLKIQIFDNYKLSNQGLASLLHKSLPNCKVDTRESWPLSDIELLKIHDLDIILLEVNMINPSTRYEEVKVLTSKCPITPICVFTHLDPGSNLKMCFESGVKGFLHKSTTIQELVKAIEHIVTGGTYLPSTLFDKVAPLAEKNNTLTLRQKEILHLLSQGLSNQEIADKLGLHIGTIKQHFHNIFKLMNAKNRVEALQVAIKHGYIN